MNMYVTDILNGVSNQYVMRVIRKGLLFSWILHKPNKANSTAFFVGLV